MTGGASISDAGLLSLHSCYALKTLDLRGTGITDSGESVRMRVRGCLCLVAFQTAQRPTKPQQAC